MVLPVAPCSRLQMIQEGPTSVKFARSDWCAGRGWWGCCAFGYRAGARGVIILVTKRPRCCNPLDLVWGFGTFEFTASQGAWHFFRATLAAVAALILCFFLEVLSHFLHGSRCAVWLRAQEVVSFGFPSSQWLYLCLSLPSSSPQNCPFPRPHPPPSPLGLCWW